MLETSVSRLKEKRAYMRVALCVSLCPCVSLQWFNNVEGTFIICKIPLRDVWAYSKVLREAFILVILFIIVNFKRSKGFAVFTFLWKIFHVRSLFEFVLPIYIIIDLYTVMWFVILLIDSKSRWVLKLATLSSTNNLRYVT